jgi:hypothetical protein
MVIQGISIFFQAKGCLKIFKQPLFKLQLFSCNFL